MPSIRITRFAGLLPEISPRLLREDHAQVAHNTLLWDGQLKPLPAWKFAGNLSTTPQSFYPDPSEPAQFNVDLQLKGAVKTFQEPFIDGAIFGLSNGVLQVRPTGGTAFTTLPIPSGFVTSQTITNQNQSVYPIPRTYAVTVLSGNMESAPFVFPQLGASGTLYEGDVVTLNFAITNCSAANPTGLRIYRTVPGFDTAEQIGNPRETAFHLVDEIPFGSGFFIYADSKAASEILGDRLLTEQFGPPLVTMGLLGVTESGWLVGAAQAAQGSPTDNRQVQVSERFLWHSWPLQNLVSIPDGITDMTVFYDEVFFGTYMKPYHMRVAFSDNVEIDSLDLTVRPLTDTYACKAGTMVTTNFGAMYASPDGLISLQVNEDGVATKKVTNPGDQLRNPVSALTIYAAQSAAWWNGFYVGLLSGVGYLFNVETNQNNQFPLGQLITFDAPAGFPGVNIVTGAAESTTPQASGLFATWGNAAYSWPMPGYGYETATKLVYTWRSKVFVMPGGTTFAGAKVVNSGDGDVQANFYGDGVLIYSEAVQDSAPFRLPHNHSCINWEIELIGDATVQEVHIATSYREITEEVGHD